MKYPRFDGDLILRQHPSKSGYFLVVNEFIYHHTSRDFARVRPGSLINGASIPWIFTAIFSRFDPGHNMATAFHDAAVGEGGQRKLVVDIGGKRRQLTWEESAEWFLGAMEADNTPSAINDTHTPRWKRNLYYQAVMLKKRPKRWWEIISS